MIFYIILVLILVGFTIWVAQLIVSKKNPEFKPEPVEKIDDLNKLDDLVGTVKKPKQEDQTQNQVQQTEQQPDNKDNDEKEYSSAMDNTNPEQDNKDSEEEEEPPKTKFSGRRGTPPKRPPRTNLREAMKNSEILGKPKAQK